MALSPEADAQATLRWDGACLRLLDQTLLPGREEWIELHGAVDTSGAIRRLAIRGAPHIGIAAAYGLAMAAAADPSPTAVAAAADLLAGSRPTAVNLVRAVDRVRIAANMAAGEMGPRAVPAAARAEAEAIHGEELLASAALCRLGADVLEGRRRILTHCNTGSLVTPGRGTALGVIHELHARNGDVRVLASETRPLLQGARLTVWELRRMGIDHELVVDGAAAELMRRGEIDAVIVGCDRVAANGDVANKVGTYAHALGAAAAGIPFVVAGPWSSIDLATPTGDAIEIEERGADEVRTAGGAELTLPGTPCRNPAFDVTPAALIAAIVTDRGVARAPYERSLAALR